MDLQKACENHGDGSQSEKLKTKIPIIKFISNNVRPDPGALQILCNQDTPTPPAHHTFQLFQGRVHSQRTLKELFGVVICFRTNYRFNPTTINLLQQPDSSATTHLQLHIWWGDLHNAASVAKLAFRSECLPHEFSYCQLQIISGLPSSGLATVSHQ